MEKFSISFPLVGIINGIFSLFPALTIVWNHGGMKCLVVADARSGTWGNSVSAIAQNSSHIAHISDYEDYQHLIAKHLVRPIGNYPIRRFVLETLLISQNSVHMLKVHISNGDSRTF